MAHNSHSVNNQLNLNPIACTSCVVIPVTEANCSAHSICVDILPKITCQLLENQQQCLLSMVEPEQRPLREATGQEFKYPDEMPLGHF